MNSCFQACLKICAICSGVTAQKSHQMPLNFTALKFSPIMPSAELPQTTFSALPSSESGGEGAADDLVGDRVGAHVAAAAVGGRVAEAHAERAARVVARQLQVLDLHRELGDAVLGGQGAGAERELGADALLAAR